MLDEHGLLARSHGALLELDQSWLESALAEILPMHPGCYPPRGPHLTKLATKLNDSSLYRPDNWIEHCGICGLAAGTPWIIRVLLHESDDGTVFPSVFRSRSSPFRASLKFERRPVATLAGMFANLQDVICEAAFHLVSPNKPKGISIGTDHPFNGTAGTLGGFLYRGPERYIFSCAHVLGETGSRVFSPGPYEGQNRSDVAVVEYADIPPPIAEEMLCQAKRDPSLMGQTDVAVARLHGEPPPEWRDVTPSTTAVRSPSEVFPYQRAHFIGKVSGLTTVQVCSDALFQTFRLSDGSYRVFSRLVELRHPTRAIASAATFGDSGSVLVDDAGVGQAICGMIVGVQASSAFAIYADDVLVGARALGLTLC
jgi:hypothetical protein